MDIFSRYVVGWMVATRENSSLAKTLIGESCAKQRIDSGRLTLHADRGPSMKSQALALLLADLGVTKSHSRPHVQDDNPYSESHFKTLKYRPEFPRRFGSIQDAREFCREFFRWYPPELTLVDLCGAASPSSSLSLLIVSPFAEMDESTGNLLPAPRDHLRLRGNGARHGS